MKNGREPTPGSRIGAGCAALLALLAAAVAVSAGVWVLVEIWKAILGA